MISLVALSLMMTATAHVDRFVVVIGNNSGGDERTPLAFADDDAARFFVQSIPSAKRAWLLTTFDRESARAYPDLVDVAREPTRLELARVLGEVGWTMREAKKSGASTELVFFYAGHGDVDVGGEGYLIFGDGPFTRADLQHQVLDASPADTNHVLIDACASFFMTPRGGPKSSGATRLSPTLLDAIRGKQSDVSARTGVFVSTSGAEEVHESSGLGGGVFSYLLRSALAGAGDVNGDGRVEYAEAAAFVVQASAGLDDPRARLEVHARAPARQPHAALADLATSGAEHFLVVDGGVGRRVRILDSHGAPFLEAFPPDGQALTLALVGSPFYVVQSSGQEAVFVPRRAGAYALSSLVFDDAPLPRGVHRETAILKGPFERSFVDGYVVGRDLSPPKDGAPLVVAWAPGGEAAFEMPWGVVGGITLGVGFALLMGSVVATVGNALAFADYQQDAVSNRQIDPTRAIAVEAWRVAALGFLTGAIVVGAAGSGLLAVEVLEEDAP